MTDLLSLAAAEQAAEDERDGMKRDSFSLDALHHALDAAREACRAALAGDTARLSALLLEAQWAADDTFPAGSPEAEALAVVLMAIGDEAMARAT
jgi:hypothetical protein